MPPKSNIFCKLSLSGAPDPENVNVPLNSVRIPGSFGVNGDGQCEPVI